jgi:nicotinamidase-related amidase
MTRKIALLSVDNQKDFMLSNGGLYVPGAEQTSFLDRMADRIDDVLA